MPAIEYKPENKQIAFVNKNHKKPPCLESEVFGYDNQIPSTSKNQIPDPSKKVKGKVQKIMCYS